MQGYVWSRGAKFSVNVSRVHKFSVVHTCKVFHTAFICIKYRFLNVHELQGFGHTPQVHDHIFTSLV